MPKLEPNFHCDNVCGALKRWLGYEDGGNLNEINAFPRGLRHPFQIVKAQEKDIQIWTGKQTFLVHADTLSLHTSFYNCKKFLLLEECIMKMWFIYTPECYSVKINEIRRKTHRWRNTSIRWGHLDSGSQILHILCHEQIRYIFLYGCNYMRGCVWVENWKGITEESRGFRGGGI